MNNVLTNKNSITFQENSLTNPSYILANNNTGNNNGGNNNGNNNNNGNCNCWRGWRN